ncbi:MAG: hypothetical protein HXX81_01465 [Campylobacterales bacterium]|nr:hypothetical protein [Campylobacterales bacterium]
MATSKVNLNSKEKADLTSVLNYISKSEQEFGVKYLIISLSILVIMLLILGPKIYIRSNIYYKSMYIEKLKYQYNSLIAENSNLKNKLEKTKFNNLVIDTTF